jgi:hypothetical protein
VYFICFTKKVLKSQCYSSTVLDDDVVQKRI